MSRLETMGGVALMRDTPHRNQLLDWLSWIDVPAVPSIKWRREERECRRDPVAGHIATHRPNIEVYAIAQVWNGGRVGQNPCGNAENNVDHVVVRASPIWNPALSGVGFPLTSCAKGPSRF